MVSSRGHDYIVLPCLTFATATRGGERGDGGGTAGMMHVVARPRPPSCREKSLSISVRRPPHE